VHFSLFVAKRYLLSRKSFNIINIISGISVGGITLGTMALIVVLSVFNGFESLIVSLYNSYNPAIKITPARGKAFLPEEAGLDSLKKLDGVYYVTEVMEDNALMKFNSRQHLITLKGVYTDYGQAKALDSMMIDGRFYLGTDEMPFAVLGAGAAYHAGLFLDDYIRPFQVFVPSRTGEMAGISLDKAFNERDISPAGIISLHQDFDVKYVLVPISFARGLFEYDREVTALEIDLKEGTDMFRMQEVISAIAGENFVVKNRFQQQELLYRIMRSEKWAIFLILTFILIIATFNMIGSLTMLIIDKKKDVAVLYSMGASNKLIRRIFLVEGMMISIIGAIAGLILGALLCLAQQQFGLLRLGDGGGSFIVQNYPVQMQWTDFVFVFLTVIIIGFLAAVIPVRQISRRFLRVKLQ